MRNNSFGHKHRQLLFTYRGSESPGSVQKSRVSPVWPEHQERKGWSDRHQAGPASFWKPSELEKHQLHLEP